MTELQQTSLQPIADVKPIDRAYILRDYLNWLNTAQTGSLKLIWFRESIVRIDRSVPKRDRQKLTRQFMIDCLMTTKKKRLDACLENQL